MAGDSATAVWFPRREAVELREEALSAVGPGDVRVRAVASALSQGTEMLVYRGQVPPGLALDLPTLAGRFSFPIKYGYASVGRVEAVGAGVESLAPDDLVFVHHPHQTRYVVPATSAVRLPADVPAERGVFLANLETAVNILLDAPPRVGDRVLLLGLGTVGLLLLQVLARIPGVTVLAVDPLAPRRRLAEALGARQAVAPDDLPAAVEAATGGKGVDLAFEASGNGAALDAAIAVAGFQATVVVCSWYGTKPVALHLGEAFHRRRLRLVSTQVGTIDPALQPRWDRERRLAVAVDLLTRLPLERLITHRVPFDRAAEAYALVDRHPEQTVQVILTYPPESKPLEDA